ncbi:hypothetical protein CL656_00485 [bacterium]|nr:hypothetical protein [bacterium]
MLYRNFKNMIKKGFTILEATFSIMILSIVISFGVYLSSKSFDSYNRFSLMNLAYTQHENRLSLVLNLIKSNQLKFPNHFDNCKLADINTIKNQDCVNQDQFQILNNLDTRVVQLDDLDNFDSLTPLFCQNPDCNEYDFSSTNFKSFPIYSYLFLNPDEDKLEIQTYYEFKGIQYSINTKLKI